MSDDHVLGTRALRRSTPIRRQAVPEGDTSNSGYDPVLGSTLPGIFHSYNANEISRFEQTDEQEHKTDLIMEKKIQLLQKQVNATHAETTATLVLAAKIEENPVLMRALAEAALLPTTVVHSSKLLERELAHQTFATRDQVLTSSGYGALEAYCHRHHLETPEEEADRVTGGKSLLQAINDLIAAGRETEKAHSEAQKAELEDELFSLSV